MPGSHGLRILYDEKYLWCPVTKYQDLSVNQNEVFGTGVFQNPNSFNDVGLEDGAEVDARQNDSTADCSSEEEDYGTDDDNNVMITKEDTYHRALGPVVRKLFFLFHVFNFLVKVSFAYFCFSRSTFTNVNFIRISVEK